MRRGVRGVCCVTALLVVAVGARPASAGFFDFLFGNPQSQPQTAPAPPPGGAESTSSGGGTIAGGLGVPTSYCVRLCDGRYFPIQRSSTVQPGQLCNALCPASRTKIYFGTDIGRASAADGSHYQDLENAFLYRKKIVDGCTCNGHSPFGLASISATEDPTLRAGDQVATADGIVTATAAARPASLRQVAASGDDTTGSVPASARSTAPEPPRPRPVAARVPDNPFSFLAGAIAGVMGTGR